MPNEADSRLPDLGAFIRSQREAARQSIRDLAKLAGVSNPYLSQIERGLRRPSAEILQQLAKALQISAESLYVRAGILDHEHEHRWGVLDAISHDDRLTADQKRSLVTVYKGFLAANSAE
ncbi:MAG: helix-turn-helix transcriptional regulator [Ilumatobacteraceae bacterium]|nr:MAG: helix-turn-helix transcriptional regulator [Actinomycetota bacterium]